MKINSININSACRTFGNNFGKKDENNQNNPVKNELFIKLNDSKNKPVKQTTTQILFNQDNKSAVMSTKNTIVYQGNLITSSPFTMQVPQTSKEARIYGLIGNSKNIICSLIYANDSEKTPKQILIEATKDNRVKTTTTNMISGKLEREEITYEVEENSLDKVLKNEILRKLDECGIKNVTQFAISTIS